MYYIPRPAGLLSFGVPARPLDLDDLSRPSAARWIARALYVTAPGQRLIVHVAPATRRRCCS